MLIEKRWSGDGIRILPYIEHGYFGIVVHWLKWIVRVR